MTYTKEQIANVLDQLVADNDEFQAMLQRNKAKNLNQSGLFDYIKKHRNALAETLSQYHLPRDPEKLTTTLGSMAIQVKCGLLK